jgi:hypothetical protein
VDPQSLDGPESDQGMKASRREDEEEQAEGDRQYLSVFRYRDPDSVPEYSGEAGREDDEPASEERFRMCPFLRCRVVFSRYWQALDDFLHVAHG